MASLAGYNPNASLLPSGGGVIQAMSGGGGMDVPPGYNASASLLPSSGGDIAPFRGGFFMNPTVLMGGEGDNTNSTGAANAPAPVDANSATTNVAPAPAIPIATTNVAPAPAPAPAIPIATTNVAPAPAPANQVEPIVPVMNAAPVAPIGNSPTTASNAPITSTAPVLPKKGEITLFGTPLILDDPKKLKNSDKKNGIFSGDNLKALEALGVDGPAVSPAEKVEILQALYDGDCNMDAPMGLLEACEPIRRIVQTLALNLLGKIQPVVAKSVNGKPVEKNMFKVITKDKEEKLKVTWQKKDDDSMVICLTFNKDQRNLISEKVEELLTASPSNNSNNSNSGTVPATDIRPLTNTQKEKMLNGLNRIFSEPEKPEGVKKLEKLIESFPENSKLSDADINRLRNGVSELEKSLNDAKKKKLADLMNTIEDIQITSSTVITPSPEAITSKNTTVASEASSKTAVETPTANNIPVVPEASSEAAVETPTANNIPVVPEASSEAAVETPTANNIPVVPEASSETPVETPTAKNANVANAIPKTNLDIEDTLTVRGIQNPGVGCYCSSVVQMLYSIPDIRSKVLKYKKCTTIHNPILNTPLSAANIDKINPEYIICALKDIFEELDNDTTTFEKIIKDETPNNTPISGKSIDKTLINKIVDVFADYKKESSDTQQDAQDLLDFILHVIKNDDDFTDILQLFQFNSSVFEILNNGSKIPSEQTSLELILNINAYTLINTSRPPTLLSELLKKYTTTPEKITDVSPPRTRLPNITIPDKNKYIIINTIREINNIYDPDITINMDPYIKLDNKNFAYFGTVLYSTKPVKGVGASGHYTYTKGKFIDSTQHNVLYNDSEVVYNSNIYTPEKNSRLVIYKRIEGDMKKQIEPETIAESNLNQFIKLLNDILPTITFSGVKFNSIEITDNIQNIIKNIQEWVVSSSIERGLIESRIMQTCVDLIEDIKKKLNASTLSKIDATNAVELHNLLLDILLVINPDYVNKTKGWKKIDTINTYYKNDTITAPVTTPTSARNRSATNLSNTNNSTRNEPLKKNNSKKITTKPTNNSLNTVIPQPVKQSPQEQLREFRNKIKSYKNTKLTPYGRTNNIISKAISTLDGMSKSANLSSNVAKKKINEISKTIRNKYKNFSGGAKKTFKKSAAFKSSKKITQKKRRST